MTSRKFAAPCLALALVTAACGGGITPPPPPPPPPPSGTPSVVCASKATTQLAAGQHIIIDPNTTSGCLRLPAADAGGAEYLLVLASTSGSRSTTGIQGQYLLKASTPASASADLAPSAARVAAPRRRSIAAEFDAMLRERERELAARGPVPAAPPAGDIATAPPVVGDVKSFKVCTNLQCSAFATVMATARYVGQHAAVFIDNEVPQNDPLTPADAAELGTAFDTYHYPIDTNAFGSESDLDQNGVVIILMTDAVNALTPNCTNGRVVGYFYGGDLLTGPNSNNGEVFYTLVPAPSTSTCTGITRRQAVDNLKPTLIHEFQHMISFNQHVLVRSGSSEETWLNEGLSHFAEELGGRLIPNSECMPAFTSCRSQYTSGDILNAYDYLKDTEDHFLIFPTSSGGTLEERGAAWLFVRWIADQFAADTILGTDLTRALVQTSLVGATNIQAVTGSTLATHVPQWLMALYLDDGPDLPAEPTGRLRYKSWGLRAIWTNPLNQAPNGPFNGFPLIPLQIAGSLAHSGTLRGGSGAHFLVVQQANGAAIDMLAVRTTANELLDALLQPRVGVVRIR